MKSNYLLCMSLLLSLSYGYEMCHATKNYESQSTIPHAKRPHMSIMGKQLKSSMMPILDNIIEKRPVVLVLIKTIHYASLDICDELASWQATHNQENAVTEDVVLSQLKQRLRRYAEKFLPIVQDNVSMLQALVRESLGNASEYLEAFFRTKQADLDTFFNNIDSIQKLYSLSIELAQVTLDLSQKVNLPKAYPKYLLEHPDHEKKFLTLQAARIES